MKRSESTIKVVTYASEVHPEITTTSEPDAAVIAWADNHSVAWKIVLGHRSAPFGKNSVTYVGWAQGGDSPEAVLSRLSTLLQEGRRKPPSLWSWRARFTLEHYEDKGFKGGLFHQFDGDFNRGCCSLDYTPETLEEVIDQFVAWCGDRYKTREVRIGDDVVRRYGERGRVK